MAQEDQSELGIMGGGGGCFPAYAQVLTEHGYKNINTIVVGDQVVSYDDTGRLALSTVEVIYVHEPQQVHSYKYWGGVIYATPNHWVLNQLNTFSEIGNLSNHDCLIDLDNTLRPLILSKFHSVEPVYNLSVSPDHTYIVEGIRVHNGGGGKGGGTPRAAVEDANTLRSKQYARVLDLISEGEIEGLVSGYQSIYYNDVPLQNSDGTFNFKDVSIETRNGTQNQAIIKDLTGIENTSIVGVRIAKATPVVRRILNLDADQVYITMEVPQLTNQDTTTGDLHGSSVSFTIEIKSDADNPASTYQAVPNGFKVVTSGTFLGTYNSSIVGWSQYREPGNCNSTTLHIVWLTSTSTTSQTVKIGLYYRVVGTSTWYLFNSKIIRGAAKKVVSTSPVTWFFPASNTGTPVRYYENVTVPHTLGTYEFKVEFIGTAHGSVAITE